MTNTTMVHVRVSKKLKDEAMKVSRDLGLSLSLVTEQAFRDLVASKRLVGEKPLVPTPYLEKILEEADRDFRENKDNPDYWSGPFTTAAEVERHLRGLMASA